MRIVVLGATGNVGTALLERLHRAPEVTRVVGVSRRGPDRAGAPYDDVEWHLLDIADPASTPRLEEILRGADAVVDLVWVIRPNRDRALLRAVNVAGNERVFRAAAAAGAMLLSLAYAVSLSIIPGLAIPIGIITSLVGVPFFVFLIFTRARRKGA